jgi:hypothetical protein
MRISKTVAVLGAAAVTWGIAGVGCGSDSDDRECVCLCDAGLPDGWEALCPCLLEDASTTTGGGGGTGGSGGTSTGGGGGASAGSGGQATGGEPSGGSSGQGTGGETGGTGGAAGGAGEAAAAGVSGTAGGGNTAGTAGSGGAPPTGGTAGSAGQGGAAGSAGTAGSAGSAGAAGGPTDSCAQCRQDAIAASPTMIGPCYTLWQACVNASDGMCEPFVNCIFTCVEDTMQPVDACIAAGTCIVGGLGPPSEGLLFLDCIYCTACTTECNGDPPTYNCATP